MRRWRKNLLDAGVSPVTVAKAYRLLKAIFNTAVDDGLIRRNPCRIKGAGMERSPERPVLTIGQVYALAEATGPRYRALVLLAVLGSLRWGELAALRRCDTGNVLAAGAGANLRELMDRMGHVTARAAMVYLHGSDERQQAIVDVLSRQTAAQLGRSGRQPSGTQRARRRRPAS